MRLLLVAVTAAHPTHLLGLVGITTLTVHDSGSAIRNAES
jgi:hypothetical protein